MSAAGLAAEVLPGRFALCRLDAGDGPPRLPEWLGGERLWALVRRDDELSLVVPEERVPPGIVSGGGFRALVLAGPFALDAAGILVRFATPLARAGVPVFAIATYDTDVVLVPEERLADAVAALAADGCRVTGAGVAAP